MAVDFIEVPAVSVKTMTTSLDMDALAIRQQAVDSYRRDVRFRALAQSIVAQALLDHGEVDPTRANREAAEIATEVAVIVLERVYREDAELHALRAERDQWRKLAEQGLRSIIPALVVPAPLSPPTELEGGER